LLFGKGLRYYPAVITIGSGCNMAVRIAIKGALCIHSRSYIKTFIEPCLIERPWAFFQFQGSRAGLFSNVSTGEFCPLRIPLDKLPVLSKKPMVFLVIVKMVMFQRSERTCFGMRYDSQRKSASKERI